VAFSFLNPLHCNETEREMVEPSKQPVECSNHSGGVQSETDFLAFTGSDNAYLPLSRVIGRGRFE